MGFSRSTLFVSQCILAASMLPASLNAQVLYGSITGNVTDKTGLPITVAKVEALNTDTGTAKQTAVDAHGSFSFNDLQPGTYKVTITATSFSTAVQNNIQLDANTSKRIDVALEVSQLNQ